MEHIFREHRKRHTESLNGEWKFCTDPENRGIRAGWFADFPKESGTLNVPGCWNLQRLDLFDYVGISWYQKEFYSDTCTLRLEFGAVSGTADVYLDGVFLGSHYGGWTSFTFDQDVESGMHRLTLRVDSTENSRNTIPMKQVDWYNYGGIIRSVEISRLRDCCIDAHQITYSMNKDLDSALLSVKLRLINGGDSVPVKVYIDDTCVFAETVVIQDGSAEFGGIVVSNLRLWDVGKGNLYTVHIVLPEDDVVEMIGFREIRVENGRILLNGKEIFLKGVNRHEEHPDWGFSVPANIARRDLEIIKNLGCNFVRGSHYPQSHTWLDYLDREGILFWCEIPMWGPGYGARTLEDPLMVERGLQMHREMAEQYCHHPSIVVWGLHNEICTDTLQAYGISKKFRDLLRSIAPDRLITYATNRCMDDICFDLADFISLNEYHGWYRGTAEDWSGFLKQFRARVKELGFGGKPIVLSEFGCAALAGYNSFSGDKWTMDYQAQLLRTVIGIAAKTEGYCGTLVWQYADIKSDRDINRARSFNNKGLVDEYRRPKLAYYAVQECFQNIP